MNILVVGTKGSGKSYFIKRHLSDDSLENFRSLFKRVLVVDALNEYNLERLKSLNELREYYYRKRISINPLYFADLILIIKEFCLKNPFEFTLIFDELMLYLDKENKNLMDLIQISRHLRINLIMISQRPYKIPQLINSLVDYYVIFKLINRFDIRFFTLIDERLDEYIRKLKKYEFILYDVFTNEIKIFDKDLINIFLT